MYPVARKDIFGLTPAIYSGLGLLAWLALAAQFWLPLPFRLPVVVASLSYLYLHRKTTERGPKGPEGMWYQPLFSRRWQAWGLAVLLTSLYSILYWRPSWLGLGTGGEENTGLIRLFDPLSHCLKGSPASEWFAYGFFYTWAVILFGITFIRKYKNDRYQVYRTYSIMFFQVAFAFLLPEILMSLRYPYVDIKHFWPLNYSFFFDWHLDGLMAAGKLGWLMLFWGIAGFTIVTPMMTWYYGKRWYCSWVCGCGALAETAGDGFRHLSDKSDTAWRIEQRTIYPIFILCIMMTILVLYTRFTGAETLAGISSHSLSHWYGFVIGSLFSGVAGVGFYPILGNRLWCRFGCPLAAYMGLIQTLRLKYTNEGRPADIKPRFRITTNGGQCISCGQCSNHCEMGIDVKSYAQRGEDIVRASCVGCGICSAVCPRDVLNLELKSEEMPTGKV